MVTSSVLPLVRVPVAVHCRLVFGARVAVLGVIVIDFKTGVVTSKVADPGVAGLFVAVIVTGLPVGVTPTPVAKPLPTIDTSEVTDDVHVTLVVMSCVVRSVKVPVAVNCC